MGPDGDPTFGFTDGTKVVGVTGFNQGNNLIGNYFPGGNTLCPTASPTWYQLKLFIILFPRWKKKPETAKLN